MRRIVDLENVTVSMTVKELYQMCLETLRQEQELHDDDETYIDFVCVIGALEELIKREE